MVLTTVRMHLYFIGHQRAFVLLSLVSLSYYIDGRLSATAIPHVTDIVLPLGGSVFSYIFLLKSDGRF